jgi:copper homeostasis protein
MPEGGTTPSYSEIMLARQSIDIKLHVIIRPRGGDFFYTPLERKIMLKDIEIARLIGADGLVFGCLDRQGNVDSSFLKELVDASYGLSTTFHRAFDMCRNPKEALETIIDAGCNRILTSGQEVSAEKGIPLLTELVAQAGSRIVIMPGCGVNEHNIAKIAKETKAVEFHFSAREKMASAMEYRKSRASMGGDDSIDEYSIYQSTPEKVKKVIKALQS